MRIPTILVLLGSSAALVSATPHKAALNQNLHVRGDGPFEVRPLLRQRQVAGHEHILVDSPVLLDADGFETSVAEVVAASNDAFVFDDTASEDSTSASSDTDLDDDTVASDDTTASDSTDAVQDSEESEDASVDSEP